MQRIQHATDKWEGVISFKCEFNTYDNLPDTINHQTVDRAIGKDGDHFIEMKTVLFVFK